MNRSSPLQAALHCATRWGWPVLPGAVLNPPSAGGSSSVASAASAGEPSCSCPDAECVVPGAHPFDPELLAATTDARMIGWWWSNRPAAPLILATGGSAPSALSLPAVAGARALAEFERLGERLGPVVATPTRFALLVAPYELSELGERLNAHDHVPSSLRFHGEGGYLALPPSHTGAGRVRWELEPVAADAEGACGAGDAGSHAAVRRPRWSAFRAGLRGALGGGGRSGRDGRRGDAATGGLPEGVPYLPRMERVLDVLVEASTTAPGSGSRLTY